MKLHIIHGQPNFMEFFAAVVIDGSHQQTVGVLIFGNVFRRTYGLLYAKHKGASDVILNFTLLKFKEFHEYILRKHLFFWGMNTNGHMEIDIFSSVCFRSGTKCEIDLVD